MLPEQSPHIKAASVDTIKEQSKHMDKIRLCSKWKTEVKKIVFDPIDKNGNIALDKQAVLEKVTQIKQCNQDGNNTLTFQKCINGLVVMRGYAFENGMEKYYYKNVPGKSRQEYDKSCSVDYGGQNEF